MPRTGIWIGLAGVCLLGAGGVAVWRWQTEAQPAPQPVAVAQTVPAEAVVPAVLRAKNLLAVPARGKCWPRSATPSSNVTVTRPRR
jgi:hypothetical protein